MMSAIDATAAATRVPRSPNPSGSKRHLILAADKGSTKDLRDGVGGAATFEERRNL
jgi:hypothetical protein